MTNCLLIIIQVHVTAVDNPEEASFFESFEAAHSSHDLSSSIAEVILYPLSTIFPFYCFFFYFLHFSFEYDDFMNRNSVSKHRQSELTVKQNMELYPEEMGLYICVSPTKDTVKKYGIMPLAILLSVVRNSLSNSYSSSFRDYLL